MFIYITHFYIYIYTQWVGLPLFINADNIYNCRPFSWFIFLYVFLLFVEFHMLSSAYEHIHRRLSGLTAAAAAFGAVTLGPGVDSLSLNRLAGRNDNVIGRHFFCELFFGSHVVIRVLSATFGKHDNFACIYIYIYICIY